MLVTLVEIAAITPATGITQTIRLSIVGAGSSAVILDGYQWFPYLTATPQTVVELVQSGEIGITVEHGEIAFAAMGAAKAWRDFIFDGATARVFVGEEGAAFSAYEQTFEGTCGASTTEGPIVRIPLMGRTDRLGLTDLLTSVYSGTGGTEGLPEMAGTLKPVCFGRALNVDPVLVDAIKQVYQVHDGAIDDIEMVFENAMQINPTALNAADVTALITMTLQPGQWAKCLPAGMFRLGGAPAGKITADVRGAKVGGTFASNIASIAADILTRAGVLTQHIDSTSFGAFSGYNWSHYATSQTSVWEAVSTAFRHAGGYVFADEKGILRAGSFFGTATSTVLKADRSALPLVIPATTRQLEVSPPVWRLKYGHSRAWTTHSDSEISPALREVQDSVQAAVDAAAAAHDAADAAKADATQLQSQLDAIASDSILDRSEKAEVVRMVEEFTAEKPGFESRADGLGVSRIDYTAAYVDLLTYLSGLTPAFSNTSANTPIVRTTWNTRFNAYLAARTALLTVIASYADIAAWGGVTGPGKPEDNATVGAPPGTPVGDRPAEEVIDQLDGNTVAIKQLPDLVTNMLIEPIDRLSALYLSYGAINMRKSIALADGNAVAIRDLKTYVDETGAVVAEDLLNLTSRVGSNEAGLLELSQTYASETEATASQLLDMIAQTNDNEAAIIEERRVRTTQDEAMATSLDQLGARVGDNESKIEDVRTATADLDSATATRFSGMETRVGDTETSISLLQSAVNDGSTATATSLDQLGVRITSEQGAREAAIQTEQQARANGDGVLSGRIDTISSEINAPGTGLRSVIQNVQQTAADNDGARAQEITSLQSRLNNVGGQVGASIENRMSTLANIDGKLQSAWTIKVQQDVNGQQYVAGGGLVMENGLSSISWLADSFRIMAAGQSPKQVFYADGNGVRIDNATIGTAAINTLQIAGNAITANQVVTGADTAVAAGGTAVFLDTGWLTIGDGVDGSGVITVAYTVDATTAYDASATLELFVDTGTGYPVNPQISMVQGVTTDSGNSYWRQAGSLLYVVDGAQVRIRARIRSGVFMAKAVARPMTVRNIVMTLMGAKR